MPEATTLYVMTAVVVAGLLVWVATVLATVKLPWARGPLEPVSSLAGLPMTEYRGAVPADEPGSAMTTGAHLPLAEIDSSVNVDDTARATPVALSEGRARAVTATVGANTTTVATGPDGTTLGMQDIRVGWLGAEGSVPQLVRRTKEEAKLRAEEALAKLHAGADFAAIQREYDDPRPTETTPARTAQTSASFSTASALTVGETSAIIATDAAYCIVKRITPPQ